MKKTILLSLITILISFEITAQTTTTTIKPKGEYAEIDLTEQNHIVEALADNITVNVAVDTIFKNIKHYNPIVLYSFAEVLFKSGEQQNGVEWYLFAQLCAIYDAERCADNSAKQAVVILESRFKPIFEKYLRKNKEIYKDGVQKAITLLNGLNQDYDYRWINLHGLNATLSAYDDKSANPLTLPKEKWAELKIASIKKFTEINSK